MVSSACCLFLIPGSATEIWSVPCFWIADSVTPRPLTRRVRMLRVWSSCAAEGALPSAVLAWYTISRPPWRSSPRCVFAPGGMMKYSETATRTAITSMMMRFLCLLTGSRRLRPVGGRQGHESTRPRRAAQLAADAPLFAEEQKPSFDVDDDVLD